MSTSLKLNHAAAHSTHIPPNACYSDKSSRLWFLSPIQDDSSDDRVYAGYGADLSTAQEITLVLPVALGALSFLAVGAIFTREAFRQWRRSGTHDEFPV